MGPQHCLPLVAQRHPHANLGVTSGRQAIDEAADLLETRGIVVAERGRFRVRERTVLRYYARTIEHLLATTGRTH